MEWLLVIHSYDKLEKMLFEIPEEETTDKKEKKSKKKDKKSSEEPERKKKKGKKIEGVTKPSKKSSNPCPHGFTYASDTGSYDECDSCEKFDKCHKTYLKNEK